MTNPTFYWKLFPEVMVNKPKINWKNNEMEIHENHHFFTWLNSQKKKQKTKLFYV